MHSRCRRELSWLPSCTCANRARLAILGSRSPAVSRHPPFPPAMCAYVPRRTQLSYCTAALLHHHQRLHHHYHHLFLPPDREAHTIAADRRPQRVANAGRRSQGASEGSFLACRGRTAGEMAACFAALARSRSADYILASPQSCSQQPPSPPAHTCLAPH